MDVQLGVSWPILAILAMKCNDAVTYLCRGVNIKNCGMMQWHNDAGL